MAGIPSHGRPLPLWHTQLLNKGIHFLKNTFPLSLAFSPLKRHTHSFSNTHAHTHTLCHRVLYTLSHSLLQPLSHTLLYLISVSLVHALPHGQHTHTLLSQVSLQTPFSWPFSPPTETHVFWCILSTEKCGVTHSIYGNTYTLSFPSCMLVHHLYSLCWAYSQLFHKHSICFGILCFHFHSFPEWLISLIIFFLWPIGCLRVYCLMSACFFN